MVNFFNSLSNSEKLAYEMDSVLEAAEVASNIKKKLTYPAIITERANNKDIEVYQITLTGDEARFVYSLIETREQELYLKASKGLETLGGRV